MSWGFPQSIAFTVALTIRDMSREKNKRLIKTQKFYQECYEEIANDSEQAFNIVTKVVQKASRRYIPNEIISGSRYLTLYAFSLVIERQGMVTSEQRKIIKIYFDNMPFPFSQSSYLSAAKTGSELVDFRKIISISKSYAGGFWVNFFRALYKSGTQKDLQDMIDYTTSIIMRFSLLGNPSSNVATGICQDFIENINYQINQVREISIKEVDWLGVIPISDRIAEMKSSYVKLIDTSNITETVSRDDLISMLDLLIMNGICDVVMMTKQPKSIKLGMINDAVEFSGIHAELTPEQYVHEIANNTDLGRAYKEMLSSGPPLGQLWHIIYMMGGQTGEADAAIGITYNMISVLIQVENYLDEKYNFLGRESIAQNYMMHIVKQLAEVYD